ncbi:MAG: hypothetical protein IPN32_02525 [Deltaproteobacteria bacterium]|nr:hypothetical protein [Deltaproteobacteria bacterium]
MRSGLPSLRLAGRPRAPRRALTTAEALGLVHQLADLGVREVTLIGGEATTPTSAARAATSPRSPQLDTPGDSLLA